jgi:type IV pilus assembly protein PilV
MLEAVIALLVLSIGLLGLAGLQSTSTRLSHESHLRSITTLAASEIIDKIRMRTGKQPRVTRAGIVDSYVTTGPAAICDPAGSGIADDLACWQKNLEAQLPAGEGAVINGGNGFVTVRILWEDRETGLEESIDWNYMVGTL